MRRRAAWLAVAAIISFGIGAGIAAASKADNYGGVSRATIARETAMIHKAFDRYGVSGVMLCIVNRESGFNSLAVNWRDSHGGSFGLFQINATWSPGGHIQRDRYGHILARSWRWINAMWNPATNIGWARDLYRTMGLQPWGGGCG